jgi:hypothetical protein
MGAVSKFKSSKAEAASELATPERLSELAGASDTAVQRAVAKNPRTPPTALEVLSHSKDKSTRESVAGNPNSPAAVLCKLGGQFPNHLLNNPALDWMLLENPGLFSEVPEETLSAIAKREDCSPQMLGHLAMGGHGRGLLMALVQNGNTPASAIQTIIKLPVEKLAGRFEVPEDSLSGFDELARMHVTVLPKQTDEDAAETFWSKVLERALGLRDSSSKPVHLSFATLDESSINLLQQANLPAWVQDELMAWAILLCGPSAAIQRFNLPSAILQSIASSGDEKVIKLLVKSRNCPVWMSSIKVAQDARDAIVGNSEAASTTLSALAETRSIALKIVLTQHPLSHPTPSVADLLTLLASSPVNWIREYVAGHVQAPHTILLMLVNDADVEVLAMVAENKGCPEDVFIALFEVVSKNPRGCGHGKFAMVERSLAANPQAPQIVLDALAERGETEVACNPNASPNALRTLFTRFAKHSLRDLAKHKALPVDCLEEISRSKDSDVLSSLLENDAASEAMLLSIAKFKDEDQFTYGKWDRKLINHPNTTGLVLDVLIERGLLDINDFGVRLAKDHRISGTSFQLLLDESRSSAGFAPVRKALAANPSTPIALIEQLATDNDESVCKAANRALKSRSISKSE